ncbi:MAG: preprotein translocase subunit SecY [Candidatus Micrarchaeia archaeon]
MGLEQLRPIIERLPEVKAPLIQPTLNERLFFTAAVLVLFFVMYHIYPVGVVASKDTQTEFLQMVLASKMGSLLTTGIGPIVLASIFLQLFVGAKIINLDLSVPKNKVLFQGTQKLLAIILALFEAYIYTNLMTIDPIFGDTGTRIIVALQVALGSILLLYFDEVVSKYGIGSGIGLFIAAGVSLSVVSGLIGILTGYGGIPASNTVIYHLAEGGANAIPSAILTLVPIIATLLVLAVSVYAENIKVEVPLAFERARGYGGRFPIKFLYTSNMPVILAFAFISAIQLLGRMLAGLTFEIGGVPFSDFIAVYDPTGRLVGGLFYLISPSFPNPIALAGGIPVYINLMLTSSNTWMVPFIGAVIVPEYIHALMYVVALVIMSIIFGYLWTETSGMTARDVAGQLKNVGLSVPGFRRDPRMIEGILSKYIPVITILGSGFVGLLAGMADLTGALGTGTGILLTAGILHRTYEEMQSRQMFEMYPALRKMMGEE